MILSYLVSTYCSLLYKEAMNERGEENVNFLRISVQTSYPYSQSLTLLSIWRCYKIILVLLSLTPTSIK